MLSNTTITAICTGHGGAIAVLRVSGNDTLKIVSSIFKPLKKGFSLASDAEGNRIYNGYITDSDGNEIDRVVVSVYLAPHSYTGEDVVEISCHASSYIQKEILNLLIKNGAQLAKPGEFTRRAFQNKKMDLSQAEAVADLIASKSKAEHDIAVNQMRGGITLEIKRLRDLLLQFTSLMELELDFSEEDVEFADRTQLTGILNETETYLSRLVNSFRLGNAIKNGIPVAICGEPNAGKSTLLNALLNDERAIVSDIPGTTRDVLEDYLNINGVTYRLIDTAGIRATDDQIEKLGIDRAKNAIQKVDIVLIVLNAAGDILAQFKEIIPNDFPKSKVIAVVNKSDICGDVDVSVLPQDVHVVKISAKHRTNLDALFAKISQLGVADYNQDAVILTNVRHYTIFAEALSSIQRAETALNSGLSGEFVSQDIRDALRSFAEITGDEITTDEVLGNIFKNFCIGK
ncbi:MAG: tRNA uridine-5-carboxymethylaminomethyl(34) synthesis GTPase MnmE [Bacteroidales bacterium]|nr:tRNA uridine-5-carboxymethylaminomethyl(34) synthesis GTPase MnmE [Bacteroidales bacterium]